MITLIIARLLPSTKVLTSKLWLALNTLTKLKGESWIQELNCSCVECKDIYMTPENLGLPRPDGETKNHQQLL